ncbi:SMC-Scp complex subunit ScpB [Bengtsoniella intestinalis]|uniref:SMC-Scp complex subunit ScpB n=1 Tax=Bengtsoniella intestinalis TaxID=3073143 RepID=UPI00391FAA27
MEWNDMLSTLEAVLFAAGEPVPAERLCLALDLEFDDMEKLVQGLKDQYAYERRGMRIVQMEDCYQMCSSPDYADQIRKAFELRKTAKLSQPALEALTIVAYYQPTTRAYVDQIRGVDSGYTMGLLLERGLIEECGRLQVIGRPHIYRTTHAFLRTFHLASLEELPPMPEFGVASQMQIEELSENRAD